MAKRVTLENYTKHISKFTNKSSNIVNLINTKIGFCLLAVRSLTYNNGLTNNKTSVIFLVIFILYLNNFIIGNVTVLNKLNSSANLVVIS